jgi:hypothetical protein
MSYCLILSSYLIRNFDYIIHHAKYICKSKKVVISGTITGKSQWKKKILFSLFILRFFEVFIQFIRESCGGEWQLTRKRVSHSKMIHDLFTSKALTFP